MPVGRDCGVGGTSVGHGELTVGPTDAKHKLNVTKLRQVQSRAQWDVAVRRSIYRRR